MKRLLFTICIIMVLMVQTLGVVHAQSPLEFGKNGIGNVVPKSHTGNDAYNIRFNTTKEPDKLVSLNDDEKIALLNGNDVDLVVYAKKFTQNSSLSKETALLDSAVNNSKISGEVPRFITYLDISLFKEVGGEEPLKTQVDEANTTITFSIDTPEIDTNVPVGYIRNYYLFSLQGEAVSMDGPYIDVNGLINIDLQKFSLFALTYLDLPPEVVNSGGNAPSANYSYNEPPTSPSEIREKINSMENTDSANTKGADFNGFVNNYNENEDMLSSESEDENINNGKQPEYLLEGSNSVSFKTIITAMIFFDLILLAVFAVVLYSRNKNSAN